jgi:hypothetical protein
MGNTDEMLFAPESLTEIASQAPRLQPLWTAIQDIAAWTGEALGAARLAWLRALPRVQLHEPRVLVHASPESLWVAPAPEATDAELDSVYSPLCQPLAIYAHSHRLTFEDLPI